MRILHTSDWHLGRTLCGRRRGDEFEAFLSWLCGIIERERIDALLVAGDIFDTGMPGNRARELYYRFLRDVASSSCRHTVIIAGNHDSPSFLDAPRELLEILNVHIVSGTSEDLAAEVLVIDDSSGNPSLIVCAVPYLRDRDVRLSVAGEDASDRNSQLIQGIVGHYDDVASFAAARRDEIRDTSGKRIPVVIMGHLFTTGGRSSDVERELYVGTLAQVPADMFRRRVEADYVALGHLHVPQTVGGSERMRYSGSPIPMSFGESSQKKFVYVVDFDETDNAVRPIEVPVFRRIESVKGSLAEIEEAISKLGSEGGEVWIEVIHSGGDTAANLRAAVEDSVRTAMDINADKNSIIDVIRVRDERIRNKILSRLRSGETLNELDHSEIFRRFLDSAGIQGADRDALTRTYDEAVFALNSPDVSEEGMAEPT
ncbi:MAG: exonuclease SbcCD subunit D C-terminal domain-containing protein [Synergistaceae bacterium]|nr:exonuclease SbcCD subunit D C-terminal domain-containing protein [Synergistaceae bacterium]